MAAWFLLKSTTDPWLRGALTFTFWANLVATGISVALLTVHGALDLALWQVSWAARRRWHTSCPHDPVPF